MVFTPRGFIDHPMNNSTVNIKELLHQWLATQGPNYKRAALAAKIGVSPHHLNAVLQGKRNLSAQAESRAIAAMDLSSLGGPALRRWLKEQGIRINEFAARVGKSPKTVEDWVYRSRKPSASNRALIFAVTRLPHFAPQPETDKGRALEEPGHRPENHVAAKKQGEGTVAILYRFIRELQSLSTGPRAGRDRFRQRVPGADIGYIRSLLAALLDEEQLEDWRRMTSYRPGLGGSSR